MLIRRNKSLRTSVDPHLGHLTVFPEISGLESFFIIHSRCSGTQGGAPGPQDLIRRLQPFLWSRTGTNWTVHLPLR